MTIVNDEVQSIAHLARIGIKADEITEFAAELSKIMDFVARMDAVDTADIEPLAHPLDAASHNREDVVIDDDMRETLQANAPQMENSLYLVPKVIE
ncbi:MAG: aspartyl-tRNA(Asn)/glutamyl-tRNA(Gln) amidotransferase subunit C [Gammaproteobacteria bacterium]|jgi:aspartyl-tRNA(Asn)/glutamyl-tRNA(Gln) amidotransferase subunit C